MQFTYTDDHGDQQTVEMPPQLVREIDEQAKRTEKDFPEAIAQLISSGSFLEKVQAAGGKVIVDQDNQLREVVREPRAV